MMHIPPSDRGLFEVQDASGAAHQVHRNPASVTFPAVGLLAEPDSIFVWHSGLTHREFIAAAGADGIRLWLYPGRVRISLDAFLFVETEDEAEEKLRASKALAAIYPAGIRIEWCI
ncbi:hypothetical protein [Niveispirillum sp. KHB5.9]|uniref:hypothetical protein n=1 Tax=Niveispirillum sp. KHB5.9 TaxID=3400269 RepID=UPI003A8407F3